MTDLGEIHFLPRLMRQRANKAPGVTVGTVRNTSVNLGNELESGRVDLAIGLLPHLNAGLFQRHLFRQRYVCIFQEVTDAAGFRAGAARGGGYWRHRTCDRRRHHQEARRAT